jgi:hypothetical protein
MYSPEQGRFVSRDALGYVDGLGLHEAFGGNPYNSDDPLGMQERKQLSIGWKETIDWVSNVLEGTKTGQYLAESRQNIYYWPGIRYPSDVIESEGALVYGWYKPGKIVLTELHGIRSSPIQSLDYLLRSREAYAKFWVAEAEKRGESQKISEIWKLVQQEKKKRGEWPFDPVTGFGGITEKFKYAIQETKFWQQITAAERKAFPEHKQYLQLARAFTLLHELAHRRAGMVSGHDEDWEKILDEFLAEFLARLICPPKK